MAVKWVSVSADADVTYGCLRILAVDDKGDLWLLVKQTDTVIRDTILHQTPNVWVKLTPPHP